MANERFRVVEPEPANGVAELAAAMNTTITTARLATELASHQVPMMILKGSPVQQRLLGTERAYSSADVDLLIHPGDARLARSLLKAEGWRFCIANGLLWRIDRAAAFERRGVVVDLHWGLHVGPLLSWTTRPLERELWDGAQQVEAGWWEPRIEPLLVYLCLHAAAFRFTKPAGLRLVAGAAALVEDWDEVKAVSRRQGAWPAVAHTLERARGTEVGSCPPLLIGPRGRVAIDAGQLLRSRRLPPPVRAAVESTRRLRERLRSVE